MSTMKRTRIQMKIDYPAQKSTRSRSKRLTDDTEISTSRRSKLAPTLDDDLTSPQKVAVVPPQDSKRTPSKRRMAFEDCDENCSPSKKRNTSGDPIPPSPLVRSMQAVRIPLSPRQDTSLVMSPAKRAIRNLTPSRLLAANVTPTKSQALTFTSKQNSTNCTPETTNSRTISRSLNFSSSPVKSCTTAPATPSKFTGLRGCESPVKSLNSPLRNSSILSPVKNLLSPIKRLGLLSPVRCGSPVKRIGLESPRKESPYSTHVRLARQEGVCYQKAKQALHTALPERLLCREMEYKKVNDFLDSHLSKKKSGSMYISGAPGTGKTAVLSKTLNRIQEEGKYPVVYINCMSFKNSAAIYNRVLSELGTGKEKRLTVKDAMKALEKEFSTRKNMVIMILDEVDQLDSTNQEVLYTMFEWPALHNSKLVLVGIANALDLTDRILPRLQAHPKCKPQLLGFAPYTRDQLMAVLKDRLSRVSVNGEQVIEPAAVQFCARKVASQAGDMRKALDVCRRAVEMVEADVRKQQIIQTCLRSPSKQAPAIPKKIGVGHILKIINEVYGSRVSAQADQTIPLQQKLAVCTLLLLSKKAGKFREVTLGKLHESFGCVCRQQQVAGVEQGEFHALCGLLEARGIVALTRPRGRDASTRSVKVTLRLDERELEAALKDKTLMSAVLAKGL